MDNTIHHNVIYAGIQPFREFSYESSAELVHICQSYYHTSRDLLFLATVQYAVCTTCQYAIYVKCTSKSQMQLQTRQQIFLALVNLIIIRKLLAISQLTHDQHHTPKTVVLRKKHEPYKLLTYKNVTSLHAQRESLTTGKNNKN